MADGAAVCEEFLKKMKMNFIFYSNESSFIHTLFHFMIYELLIWANKQSTNNLQPNMLVNSVGQ